MKNEMTSMERVLTSLAHGEPDRVPLFLMLTMHGAKELGMTIRDYYSSPESIAEGQERLYRKYRNDCIYTFTYAALEVEAFGGEVLYGESGPPNSGRCIIKDPSEIEKLKVPDARKTPCLARTLEAQKILASRLGGEVPIIGVVMSPFSLPVMQMGFDRYFDLMYESPELFGKLMEINTNFCVEWANAQLEAGATAICYFDPVSSPTIVPRELYLRTGYLLAEKALAMIKGPVAVHLASGRVIPVIDDFAQAGAVAIGASALEELSDVKAAAKGKLTVIGNLNGIEMRRWGPREAERAVKEAISEAAPGGGFILSDNHGEVPYQVKDEVLAAISEAVRKWGRYPIAGDLKKSHIAVNQ